MLKHSGERLILSRAKLSSFSGRVWHAFGLRGTISESIVRACSTFRAFGRLRESFETFQHLLIDAASPIRSPNRCTCTLFMKPSAFSRYGRFSARFRNISMKIFLRIFLRKSFCGNLLSRNNEIVAGFR